MVEVELGIQCISVSDFSFYLCKDSMAVILRFFGIIIPLQNFIFFFWCPPWRIITSLNRVGIYSEFSGYVCFVAYYLYLYYKIKLSILSIDSVRISKHVTTNDVYQTKAFLDLSGIIRIFLCERSKNELFAYTELIVFPKLHYQFTSFCNIGRPFNILSKNTEFIQINF